MYKKYTARIMLAIVITSVYLLMSLPAYAASVSTDDYRVVIADMPRVGEKSASFPQYISFNGDPSYAGSFSGTYNGLDIDGYVDRGRVASLVIRPAAGAENGADAAIAQAISNIYGRPYFAQAPEVYEWKYTLNESRWTIQYFGSAGVFQGGR